MTLDSIPGPQGLQGVQGIQGEAGAPGSSAWADLTGSPSDNADLQTALGLRLLASNNLSDLGSASAARTNLGLGTLATQNGTLSDYLTIANAVSAYQPLDSQLTTIAALADGDGVLANNGSGTFSYVGRTTSGEANKIPVLNGGGICFATGFSSAFGSSLLNEDGLYFASGIGQGLLATAVLGANRTWTLPNVTGTLITTGDTGTIAAAMLAAGSVTMAKINQAGATTGQAIAWNGSAWAPATIAAGATLAATPTGTRITGYWPSAPTGYVLANGDTIGNASSGATRANADTEALFTLLYTVQSGVFGLNPVDIIFDSNGNGLSSFDSDAATSYALNRRLRVPDERLRVPVMAQVGSPLAEAEGKIGAVGGAATHTLVESELPNHVHTIGDHAHPYVQYTPSSGSGSNLLIKDGVSDTLGLSSLLPPDVATPTNDTGAATGNTGPSGLDGAHNNVQPFICINVAIKL
jgi:microcystin-dependent protein